MTSSANNVQGSDSRGAIWRRWEPHIHTPGTALADAYGGASLDQFLDRLESAEPVVQAVGITDYLLVRRYRDVLAAKANGRLADTSLVFCNIEMRLTIETKAGKGVNLHLLVSPEDPNHIEEIERILGRLSFRFNGDKYACTEADLQRLGRAYESSSSTDEVALRAGVNQFKVDFVELRKVYDESEWMRSNVLIAVAGSSNDGTAGLQDEAASFAATRKEIEAFAHIVFTATPKNIEFWRGEGVLTDVELEKRYGGPKPCLHGSDAHRLSKVAVPDDDRFTWVKGDATFDALRQACIEPRTRVSIGKEAPTADTPFAVSSVRTPALPWMLPNELLINPGMVAVIGARGSGKTALADLIAHAGSSPHPSAAPQSFLNRASAFLADADVEAKWSNGTSTSRPLSEPPVDMPDVHYLTQQFVDRLCSSVAESDELLAEVKRIVFLAHDPTNRLGADSFDSLVKLKSTDTDLELAALNQRLDRLSQDLLEERGWYLRRAAIATELQKADTDAKKAEASRAGLIAPGGKERAEYYTRLSTAISQREQQIQLVGRRMQSLRNLQREVQRYADEVFPQLASDLKRAYPEAGLDEASWGQFVPVFSGKPVEVLAAAIVGAQASLSSLRVAQGVKPDQQIPASGLADCSLEDLKAEQARIGEQIGADKKNLQRLAQLNRSIQTYAAGRKRLEQERDRAANSSTRINELLAERGSLYVRFFELVIARCAMLSELYEPLSERLEDASGSVRKLALRVVRHVDVAAWARAGEALLDLRKNGKLRGRGSLAAVADSMLAPAWRAGTAEDVANAMELFRKEYDRSLLEQSPFESGTAAYQQWVIDLGRWLYSTEHIKVHYSIEYEGVPITQLSPGTRGIVLLLLYLALDVEDSRPLVIDQPEENLDPRSVYSELVELFRDARLRRQVVIVTHNANLVVNTDVDQVIVASCTKHGSGHAPEFHYASGGLEDASIRAAVCDILEGGEVAFRERAKRLRVRGVGR